MRKRKIWKTFKLLSVMDGTNQIRSSKMIELSTIGLPQYLCFYLFMAADNDNKPVFFQLDGVARLLENRLAVCFWETTKAPDIACLPELQCFIHEAGFQPMVAKRRNEYLAGRYCSVRCLQALNAQTTYVGRNSDRSPQWPKGFLGAITHSKGIAASMVAKKHALLGIGLDIEEIVDSNVVQEIASQVISTTEFDIIKSISKEWMSFEQLFTLVFSAKESIFKALYPDVQRFFGFESAELQAVGDSSLRFKLLHSLSPVFVAGYSIQVNYCVDARRVLTWVVIDHGCVNLSQNTD